MTKDINIHVKTPGAAQAKQQLDGIGKASRQVGQKTTAGQKQAAAATEKTTGKLTGMGRVLDTLKTQVMGFLGAFLGIQAVMKVINFLIEKLERIQQLQKSIYEKSLSFMEIGQALEFQTGTVGKQQFWAKQAAELQEAGALKPGVAGQMFTSIDLALGEQGGIKNRSVRDLAKQLAPFAGTAQMGPEEVTKLFEFAGMAGVKPTIPAYKQYFAQLQAGYTASKSTDFGQFMLGLQKGGTAYMTQGGTLTEAISTFAGARSVMPNEALAATALEQIARLSGGGYEKPRKAIESALGVQWENLSMDQRTNALLQYIGDIPESRRGQVLAEEGFPQEITTSLGKMVSSEAQKTMIATRQKVAGATTVTVDAQTQAYLDSVLGKERRAEAQISLKQLKVAPKFADWQIRLKKAKAEHEILATQGEDSLVIDSLEPYTMALDKMVQDITEALQDETLTEEEKTKYRDLGRRIAYSRAKMALPSSAILYPIGTAGGVGYKYTQELQGLQQQAPTTINIHNSQDQFFFPVAGNKADRGIGPPFTQD